MINLENNNNNNINNKNNDNEDTKLFIHLELPNEHDRINLNIST
jgi:hypothetical protein